MGKQLTEIRRNGSKFHPLGLGIEATVQVICVKNARIIWFLTRHLVKCGVPKIHGLERVDLALN